MPCRVSSSRHGILLLWVSRFSLRISVPGWGFCSDGHATQPALQSDVWRGHGSGVIGASGLKFTVAAGRYGLRDYEMDSTLQANQNLDNCKTYLTPSSFRLQP